MAISDIFYMNLLATGDEEKRQELQRYMHTLHMLPNPLATCTDGKIGYARMPVQDTQ